MQFSIILFVTAFIFNAYGQKAPNDICSLAQETLKNKVLNAFEVKRITGLRKALGEEIKNNHKSYLKKVNKDKYISMMFYSEAKVLDKSFERIGLTHGGAIFERKEIQPFADMSKISPGIISENKKKILKAEKTILEWDGPIYLGNTFYPITSYQTSGEPTFEASLENAKVFAVSSKLPLTSFKEKTGINSISEESISSIQVAFKENFLSNYKSIEVTLTEHSGITSTMHLNRFLKEYGGNDCGPQLTKKTNKNVSNAGRGSRKEGTLTEKVQSASGSKVKE